MKYIILFCLIVCSSSVAFGQVVNPTIIYQDTDIAIKNTDVYYRPFAPPDSTDTRMLLSCLGSMDSNGILHYYYPMYHGGQLATAHPCGDSTGDTIGNQVPWMRLFSANDKPSGAHSDIIAGGIDTIMDTVIIPFWPPITLIFHTPVRHSVIISKNEDVDFRATGIIKLKSGFHAKGGCFFHAYTAPKWGDTVFSDEFNDTAKFNSQWIVYDSAHGVDGGNDCSYRTNYALMPDSEAEDDWALRLDLKEGLCGCYELSPADTTCTLRGGSPPKLDTFQFSTTTITSCPWPFNGRSVPIRSAYHNAPYGKYEVREKVPFVEHHTNNYGGGQGNEFNLDEKTGGGLNQIWAGITPRFRYGPFRGRFGMIGDTQIFQSSQAHFALWNNPALIIVNNFPYEVQFDLHDYPTDTILVTNATTILEGGFPSSLIADSTDSVTFYYYKNSGNVSDTLAWSVDTTGLYFTGPYADSLGDTLSFYKGYQPIDIYLLDNPLFPPIKYNCHWDHNTGKILLTDTMSPLASHRGIGFSYDVNHGPDYPVPPINVDTNNYTYHTYAIELLPHEARVLYDGAVRYRFPDRLIPKEDIRYDCITKFPRTPMGFTSLGEIGIDVSTNPADPLGTDTTGDWNGKPVSITHQERKYFEWADTLLSHGCWPDTIGGQPAAHHVIDYVKIWDLPSDAKLPDFPY